MNCISFPFFLSKKKCKKWNISQWAEIQCFYDICLLWTIIVHIKLLTQSFIRKHTTHIQMNVFNRVSFFSKQRKNTFFFKTRYFLWTFLNTFLQAKNMQFPMNISIFEWYITRRDYFEQEDKQYFGIIC